MWLGVGTEERERREREKERRVVGGRDVVDERERECSGGGATMVCTMFLSVF